MKNTPTYIQKSRPSVVKPSPHPIYQLEFYQSHDIEITVMLKDDFGKLYPSEKKITVTIVRIPGGWLHISESSSVFIPYSNQGVHLHELI